MAFKLKLGSLVGLFYILEDREVSALQVPAHEKMPILREEKPPRRRGSRKLLWFLLLLFIVLLAVLFFRSSISKIETISISGQELLPEETVRQTLGIQPGDHFFGFRSATIADRIKTLPMVEEVKVSKKFPGLVRVQIKEYARVAYQFTADGKLEAILANGFTLPAGSGLMVGDKPILTGWSADDPLRQKLCEALARIPSEQLAEISEIKPSPTNAYVDKIKMYTRSQFEVYTTVTFLPDKMPYLEEFIAQMKEANVDSGVFEMLDADTHKSFEQYYNIKPTQVPSGTPTPGKDAKKAG